MTALWAAFKAASQGKKLFIILAVLAALLAITAAAKQLIDRSNQAQRDLGAEQVTNEALEETLIRTEKANEAAETIKRDPDARRAGCLRHSRTPENC